MKRTKRLLMIGAESHYGTGVVRGIHEYCRNHGNWEYCLELNNSTESALRAQAAIRQWKADGIVACIETQRIADLVQKSKLPAVRVTGGSASDIPAVWT